MIELTRHTFKGKAVEEIIPQLGELRIRVFYDFPYLYEGDLGYEKSYLKVYANDESSIVHAIFDDKKLVGATTGMAMVFESDEIKKPFLEQDFDLNQIFYFGESILLKDYRGLGLGHEFFDVRENYAIEKGFSITTFCSVVRPEEHELKPLDYRSNDPFWVKRGYEKQDFSCSMFWLDRNEKQETSKELQFWMKQWK